MTRTLTRKLAIIQPDILLVGVDLALKKNVAVVLDREARQVDRFSFGHDCEGYARWRERLAKRCRQEGASGVLVCWWGAIRFGV